MQKSWSIVSLIAALSVSGALATGTSTPTTSPAPTTSPSTSTQTPAGTTITNVAEIEFTPDGSTTPTKVPSNPVETKVDPVPSFTITPNDGSTDVTKPDYTKPGQTGTVVPCQKDVSFKYTLTNTGNVNGESYLLTNTPDPTGAVKSPENVRFYDGSADTDGNGTLSSSEIAAATPITSIKGVDLNKSVTFFQVYDVPCDAKIPDGEKFGTSPTGTREDNPNFTNDPTLPKDANNSNVVTVNRQDGVVVGPKNDPDANGNPVTAPYTSPEGYTITPGAPNAPAGTPAPDTQVALLTSITSTTPTTITFTNTLQNTGNSPDSFELTQTNNFPAGTKVEFRDANGQPLPDTDGDGIPEVRNVPAGGQASFQVIVTLPAGTTPTQLAGVPATVITTTSMANPTKSDTTTDAVKATIPGLSFGNPTPTPGGDPAIVGTPPAGTPGSPDSPVKLDNCTAPVRTYLPLELANTGSQPDTFVITGTAPILTLNPDGTVNSTPTQVPVTYYRDVNGDGRLDAGDTQLAAGSTGEIKPGEEIKLIAVVDVPCSAIQQTVTLNQKATSPTTGVTVTDSNDTITIGTNAAAPNKPEKTVDKANAKPGDVLTYTIMAKNTTNADLKRALVCDTVPANTDFVAWTATSTAQGTVLYNVNGGAWSATAPTTAPAGARVCAAVDTNGDSNITTADVLRPGQTISATFQVRVR